MILNTFPYVTANKITIRSQRKTKETSKTQNHQRDSKNKERFILKNLAWIVSQQGRSPQETKVKPMNRQKPKITKERVRTIIDSS